MWWLFKRARPGDDRRRHARHPIRALGQIRSPQDRQGRACILIDLCEGGAGVLLESEAELPEEVVLIVPEEGVRARAQRIWQDSGRAGFQFSD